MHNVFFFLNLDDIWGQSPLKSVFIVFSLHKKQKQKVILILQFLIRKIMSTFSHVN